MSNSSHPPDDIAQAYDRWAAHYDADRNATRDLDALVVRRAPLRLACCDVLELGCGTGKNTVWLAEQARSVVALDFSEGMLEIARRHVVANNVRFVTHDVRCAWPLGNDSVDLVIGNLVLEHVEKLAPVFAEARRVLRTDGQLFFCELHPYRQLRGGQAHFVEAVSGETIHVPAYLHSTAEFVNAGLEAGLTLRALGEWREQGAENHAPPRVLSVLFDLPESP